MQDYFLEPHPMPNSSASSVPVFPGEEEKERDLSLSDQDLNLIKATGKNVVIYLLDIIALTPPDLQLILIEIIHTLRQEHQVLSVSRIAVFTSAPDIPKAFKRVFERNNIVYLNISSPLTCIDQILIANGDPANFGHFKLNQDDLIVFAGHIDNIRPIHSQVSRSDFKYTSFFVANSAIDIKMDINEPGGEFLLYSQMKSNGDQRLQINRSLIEQKFNIPSSFINPHITPLITAAFNGEVEAVKRLLLVDEKKVISPLDAACLTKNKEIVSLILNATPSHLTPYQASQLLSKEVHVLIDWENIYVPIEEVPQFLTGLYQFCKNYGYHFKNVQIHVFQNYAAKESIHAFQNHGIFITNIDKDRPHAQAIEHIRRLQDQALVLVSSDLDFAAPIATFSKSGRPVFLIHHKQSSYTLRTNALWSGVIDYLDLPPLHQSKSKKATKYNANRDGVSKPNPSLPRSFRTKICHFFQAKIRCLPQ